MRVRSSGGRGSGDGRTASYETPRGQPEVRFIVLTRAMRLALPPLFVSSIPKRAIGFSFPVGREGKLLGGALIGMTGVLGLLLSTVVGPLGYLIAAWVTGGTGALVLYNSSVRGIAFLKPYCSRCRLRPVIEEHETMHLIGEPSEEAIWMEARKKYSYESLGLADDPRICTFCPIAKRLRSYS